MLIDQTNWYFHHPSLYQILTEKSDDRELPANVRVMIEYITESE